MDQRERAERRLQRLLRDEAAALAGAARGLPDPAAFARTWLNRLLFLSFLQDQGFLAGDPDYLRKQLASAPAGRFALTLHRLLERLFHEKGDGDLPFLGGGLLTERERANPPVKVKVASAAWARLLAFLRSYVWRVTDYAPSDNVVTPRVLGHFFEKQINQRDLGAYYTGEDVTAFMARHTVIPVLRGRGRRDLRALTVLDPACGAGAFLVAALETLEPLYLLAAPAKTNRYALRKSILLHNIYGVDLMPEAIEVCTMRLFLWLLAAAPGPEDVVPLPSLANNLRAGNVLTGEPAAAFPEIRNRGGFDAVLANPPYVEIADGKHPYPLEHLTLAGTGNLYAPCLERFTHLLRPGGRLGILVPISAVSTPRMRPLMAFLTREYADLRLSHYAVRPGKLFDGVDMNVTLILGRKATGPGPGTVATTGYQRWREAERPALFTNPVYTATAFDPERGTIPKLGSALEVELWHKLLHPPGPPAAWRSRDPDAAKLYVHSGGRYFRKCLRRPLSREYKELSVRRDCAGLVQCLFSSSLYYWFWIVVSDCYHVTFRDLDALPVPESAARDRRFTDLAGQLDADLWRHARKRTRHRADGRRQVEVNFQVGKSRPILDAIDRALAGHYHLTGEELNFLLGYDARFRVDDAKE